jgi:anti-sigma regulatory factor (Ser/Thr protein kinase)
MDVRLDLRLPPVPSAAAAARRSVTGLRAYLTEESFDSVQLLITECTTNSVRHAGLTEDDWIQIHVGCDGGCVHVEVADPGPGFSSIKDSEGPREGSGWGLYLVGRLASRWGVRHDGVNRVWFELEQPSAQPRAELPRTNIEAFTRKTEARANRRAARP